MRVWDKSRSDSVLSVGLIAGRLRFNQPTRPAPRPALPVNQPICSLGVPARARKLGGGAVFPVATYYPSRSEGDFEHVASACGTCCRMGGASPLEFFPQFSE